MSENKIAVITGASRGIGSAIADCLGESGMTIIGTATSINGAVSITKRFEEKGFSGKGFELDIGSDDSVEKFKEAISDKYGTIDILVNNAGITRDNLSLRMKTEDWDSVINTNLSSIHRVISVFLRPMIKNRGGRIINISSIVGLTGNAGQTNYAAAKAGMIGFTKSLAQEVGSRGITVNCVAPGFIDTDMTNDLPELQRERLLSSIPLGRLGSTSEIASAVAFLASDSASYITGETIHVNGGMYMA
tara:strand:- start:13891 stop:14631 length:741 start_codon:yes stop_codon:yes gene_type:complete